MKNPYYIYAKAFRGYKAMAAKGNADGQRYLGMMYENGQGVPKNCLEASRWYEKAAAQGDVGAIVRLGLLYANGRGVAKDFVQAYRLFLIADALKYEGVEKLIDQLVPKMSEDQIDEAVRLAGEWTPSTR